VDGRVGKRGKLGMLARHDCGRKTGGLIPGRLKSGAQASLRGMAWSGHSLFTRRRVAWANDESWRGRGQAWANMREKECTAKAPRRKAQAWGGLDGFGLGFAIPKRFVTRETLMAQLRHSLGSKSRAQLRHSSGSKVKGTTAPFSRSSLGSYLSSRAEGRSLAEVKSPNLHF
jgi:hypothetical protein